jgi:hypothetical protein
VPGWICPLRWDLGSREGKTGTYGGEWVRARLDLPAPAGSRVLMDAKLGPVAVLCPVATHSCHRILFRSFDGGRVPVSGAFSTLKLDPGFLARQTDRSGPGQLIPLKLTPFDAGFDFRDQNPSLERPVLASVQRCNQVMQRGSEP